MSTRFDCPVLARILEKFITQKINLFVGSVGCSVILVAGNWVLLQIEKWQNYYRVLDLFCLDNIFAKPRTKMTTVLRFSRQNEVGCARSMLLYEKISYSSSFLSYNPKLSIDLGATTFSRWNSRSEICFELILAITATCLSSWELKTKEKPVL